ncbi:hypothetical protein BDW59DRAFT_177371 [Aspergillus cavernicola]|uniref:Aminoglycoside phosphotransferase domain-containing protein n=1 Tax=Aspergillus cavernicola TaxID=176166 RepID=A0ABR4HLZ5_9EURO
MTKLQGNANLLLARQAPSEPLQFIEDVPSSIRVSFAPFHHIRSSPNQHSRSILKSPRISYDHRPVSVGSFRADEAENLRKREIRFDLDRFANVAADLVGAARCVSMEKYPDDMVPNPDAGVPHFTTASEVATIDFARRIINTPAPRVYSWNLQAKSHPIGLKAMSGRFVLGSLYYAGDVQSPSDKHYVQDGKAVKDSKFAIGSATGRDWFDGGRSILDIERAMYVGLYRPDPEKKLTALACYRQIIDALIPNKIAITNPCLWHNNLHCDNIFVDLHNPEDGLESEKLDLSSSPKLTGLSPEERSAAVREYTGQNVLIGWRKLILAKNPGLYRVVEFRRTAAYGLIFLARRMFEYGEAHFQSLLIDLKDTWMDLPAVTSDVPFLFELFGSRF